MFPLLEGTQVLPVLLCEASITSPVAKTSPLATRRDSPLTFALQSLVDKVLRRRTRFSTVLSLFPLAFRVEPTDSFLLGA